MKPTTPTLFEREPPESSLNPWARGSPVEESRDVWKGKPVIFEREKALPKSGLFAVELFCGCGGTSIGLEMAGMVCAVGCDILGPAIQTYRSVHPRAAAILGDVRAVDPETIVELLNGRPIDVLVGGFPCQGFSLSNRKRHDADPRSLRDDLHDADRSHRPTTDRSAEPAAPPGAGGHGKRRPPPPAADEEVVDSGNVSPRVSVTRA